MAITKQKIRNIVNKSFNKNKDLLIQCSIFKTQEGSQTYNPITGHMENAAEVEKSDVYVLPNGNVANRVITNVSLPTDKVFYAFYINEEVNTNDEFLINGIRYKVIFSSDQTVGLNIFHELILRELDG